MHNYEEKWNEFLCRLFGHQAITTDIAEGFECTRCGIVTGDIIWPHPQIKDKE